jgi:hypothetical protein
MSVDFRWVAAVALATLSGCSQPPAPTASNAIPAVTAPDSFRDFGDYVVHFNAFNTDQLTAEIARQYDIVRSSNRAMLNVSILRKEQGTSGVPVSGSVAASAVNLTGQLKELTLREIREEAAVYYIAEFAVANQETLIFTIDVTPLNEPSRFSVRYMKQFYVN